MGAVDRTQLASLGFADRDKRSGRHTQACMWLASSDGMGAVFEHVKIPDVVSAVGEIEVPISKGEGRYKTTIGFLDVVLRTKATYEYECEEPPYSGRNVKHRGVGEGPPVYIEVKISPEDIGSVLRQINLYREYLAEPFSGKRAAWVLVVDWDCKVVEVEILKRYGISVLRLGARFERFLRGGGVSAGLASL